MKNKKISKRNLVCYICKSKKIKEIYLFKEYRILKCDSCGIIFTDQSELSKDMYNKEYFIKVHSKYFSDCLKDYDKIHDSKKLLAFKKGLGTIRIYKNQGKILDIGCATGVFLDIARKNSWKVTGVDISKYACEYAKKKFKLDVKQGEIEDIKFPKKTFDVITMWDTLEHVQNPNITLTEIRRILKDDGVLFIHTINEDSLMSKLAHLIYIISFKKVKFFVKLIHPIHHNFHFSEKTLKDILLNNRFLDIYKKKSELPINNIEEGRFIKFIAMVLYFFSYLLNKQHEISLI